MIIVIEVDSQYEIDFEVFDGEDIEFVGLNRKVPENVEPVGDTLVTDEVKLAMEILSVDTVGWAKLEKTALDRYAENMLEAQHEREMEEKAETYGDDE